MKDYIQRLWESHFWYQSFLERFIGGQRRFYNELYQDRNYVVFINNKK